MTISYPPFALFVIAKSIPVSSLNRLYKEGYESLRNWNWDYWFATTSWDEAPRRGPEGGVANATPLPINDDFVSPWAGKKPEEVAAFLLTKPEDVAVNPHFFAIVDDHSNEENTVTVCRIGWGQGRKRDFRGKEGELQFYPMEAEIALACLCSVRPGDWDERLEQYQSRRERLGLPDYSQGRSVSEEDVEGEEGF